MQNQMKSQPLFALVPVPYEALVDAGIEIGPASGRGFAWIPPFFGGDEACCATALATNASQIYLHGELIHEEHLDHDGLERLRQVIAEIPNAGLLCFEGGTPRVEKIRVVAQNRHVCDVAPGRVQVVGNGFHKAEFAEFTHSVDVWLEDMG